MKMGLYSVYDEASRTYNRPVTEQTDAQALRIFKQEINRAEVNNLMNSNPEDFSLYHVGTFDTDTGTITPADPIRLMSTGLSNVVKKD